MERLSFRYLNLGHRLNTTVANLRFGNFSFFGIRSPRLNAMSYELRDKVATLQWNYGTNTLSYREKPRGRGISSWSRRSRVITSRQGWIHNTILRIAALDRFEHCDFFFKLRNLRA